MKVSLKKQEKIFIGIFGMPNSGTTLLSSSFHCMKNGFCLCEPHLSYNAGGHQKTLMLDKIGGKSSGLYPRLKNGDFITDLYSINKKLIKFLNSEDKYNIGGIKECYWTDKTNSDHKSFFNDVILQNCYDIVLFIFREPKAMYLSQIKKGFVPIDGFIDDYKSFYKHYENLKFDNKFLINYEKLCIGGAKYLEEVLKDQMEFEGNISLHPTSFATGSWSQKNLRKNNRLNKMVNKPKVFSDFSKDFINNEKIAIDKISKHLNRYKFLWQ